MAEKDDKKPDEKPGPNKGDIKEDKPAPKDNIVTTNQRVRIGGKEIRYTVTTGTVILKEETADREKEAEGEEGKEPEAGSYCDRTGEAEPQPRLLGGEDQEDNDEVEEIVVQAPVPRCSAPIIQKWAPAQV